MHIQGRLPGYSYELVEQILFQNNIKKNRKERPSGCVTIKDLGVYEASILCDDEWVPIAYMESALPPRGQDQFDLTPEMEIAKGVEEIGADLDAYCRFTSDDFWSAYQQALRFLIEGDELVVAKLDRWLGPRSKSSIDITLFRNRVSV